MLAIAAELGAGFDFIRVDLYDIDGEVFFGEVTPYPDSGLGRFLPASFDTELGACGNSRRIPTEGTCGFDSGCGPGRMLPVTAGLKLRH
jgi:TupA-like ATPgrasp